MGQAWNAAKAARRPALWSNASVFGAICPARGVGAALALPYADADMMQLHLDEISRHVADGADAVCSSSRARWRTTGELDVPADVPRACCLPARRSWTRSRASGGLSAGTGSRTPSSRARAIIDAACAAGEPWLRPRKRSPAIENAFGAGRGGVARYKGWC